jgi:hypothetical protein
VVWTPRNKGKKEKTSKLDSSRMQLCHLHSHTPPARRTLGRAKKKKERKKEVVEKKEEKKKEEEKLTTFIKSSQIVVE